MPEQKGFARIAVVLCRRVFNPKTKRWEKHPTHRNGFGWEDRPDKDGNVERTAGERIAGFFQRQTKHSPEKEIAFLGE